MNMKLDFLTLLGCGVVLPLEFQVLFLLILQFAKVHNADHWRSGPVRDQYQIQPRLLCNLPSTEKRHYIKLFTARADQSYPIRCKRAIPRFQQLSNNNTSTF